MSLEFRTGRPLGGGSFVARLEALTGRKLGKMKPEPKPRAEAPQGAGPDN